MQPLIFLKTLSLHTDPISISLLKHIFHLVNKGKRYPDFPYRKFVLCPECKNPLLGSASRGKGGKYYPAYHCSHYGHYYRIPKQQLEDTVAAFIRNLTVSQDCLQDVLDAVATEWNLRNQSQLEELQDIQNRIDELEKDARVSLDKIRILSSPMTIKLMEEDIMRIEQQIQALKDEKAKKEAAQPTDFARVMGRVKYFVEHLDELLLQQIDPIKKAQLFGIIFDQTPTVDEINCGTPKTPLFTGVNPVFALAKMTKSHMVNLTTTQVETLFGELEYIEPRLKALGLTLADKEADRA